LKRIDRNGITNLHGPAVIEVGGPNVPQPVPVVARLLVGDLPVEHAALRVRREPKAVAAIVKRVEQDREVVVVVHVAGVASHVAGHAAIGMGFPQAGADVDVLVVEEHPQLGLVAGWTALGRLLLDEAAGGWHRRVERLVEAAVERHGRSQPRGAEHRVALCVARDRLGRSGRILRRRRAVHVIVKRLLRANVRRHEKTNTYKKTKAPHGNPLLYRGRLARLGHAL